LFERDRSGPVEGARGAVDRGETVAGFAHRNATGVQEADVAADIRIDEVLSWRLIEAQRIEKFAPVPRGN